MENDLCVDPAVTRADGCCSRISIARSRRSDIPGVPRRREFGYGHREQTRMPKQYLVKLHELRILSSKPGLPVCRAIRTAFSQDSTGPRRNTLRQVHWNYAGTGGSGRKSHTPDPASESRSGAPSQKLPRENRVELSLAKTQIVCSNAAEHYSRYTRQWFEAHSLAFPKKQFLRGAGLFITFRFAKNGDMEEGEHYHFTPFGWDATLVLATQIQRQSAMLQLVPGHVGRGRRWRFNACAGHSKTFRVPHGQAGLFALCPAILKVPTLPDKLIDALD